MAGISTESLIERACREQLLTFSTFLKAEGVAPLDAPGIVGMDSGVDFALFNCVLHTAVATELLDETIAAVRGYFEKTGRPMMWWHRPTAVPTDLGERLRAAGFELAGSQPVMVRVGHGASRAPDVAGLAVRQVDHVEDLDLFLNVLGTGFGLPSVAVDLFRQVFIALGFGADAPVRNWLGYLDEEAVGTASLFLHGDIAGIYDIATLDHVRGRGIGAALTSVALNEAALRAIDFVSLQSSELGYKIYERLGFDEMCKFDMYVPAVE